MNRRVAVRWLAVLAGRVLSARGWTRTSRCSRSRTWLVRGVGGDRGVAVGAAGEQGRRPAPATPGGGVRAPVDAPAGPGSSGVDAAAVRAGRAGGRVGLAGRPGGGDRRGPGQVRGQRGRPLRVPASGHRDHHGPCGPGVGHRDVAAGPLGQRLVSAAGAVRAVGRAVGRRRWRVRPGRVQRPAAAGAEGDDERGRAAPARSSGCRPGGWPRPAAGSWPSRCQLGMCAAPRGRRRWTPTSRSRPWCGWCSASSPSWVRCTGCCAGWSTTASSWGSGCGRGPTPASWSGGDPTG